MKKKNKTKNILIYYLIYVFIYQVSAKFDTEYKGLHYKKVLSLEVQYTFFI